MAAFRHRAQMGTETGCGASDFADGRCGYGTRCHAGTTTRRESSRIGESISTTPPTRSRTVRRSDAIDSDWDSRGASRGCDQAHPVGSRSAWTPQLARLAGSLPRPHGEACSARRGRDGCGFTRSGCDAASRRGSSAAERERVAGDRHPGHGHGPPKPPDAQARSLRIASVGAVLRMAARTEKGPAEAEP